MKMKPQEGLEESELFEQMAAAAGKLLTRRVDEGEKLLEARSSRKRTEVGWREVNSRRKSP